MSLLLLRAPPEHACLLLSWGLTSGQDLRQVRIELRHFFAGNQQGDQPEGDDVAGSIGLVATELGGNALRHGLPPIVVRLLRDDDCYILDVRDHDPHHAPVPGDAPLQTGAGGRGLHIARSLARQLCWYKTEGAKHVWASFPVPVGTTPPFTISGREAPSGVLRVSLSGDFDTSVGDALFLALVEAAHRPGITKVIVDLEHTHLIDSHAAAGLVSGYEAATAAHRGYTVVNGRGLVQQVLDITGLAEVLCGRP